MTTDDAEKKQRHIERQIAFLNGYGLLAEHLAAIRRINDRLGPGRWCLGCFESALKHVIGERERASLPVSPACDVMAEAEAAFARHQEVSPSCWGEG
jgi:hypothetical protein